MRNEREWIGRAKVLAPEPRRARPAAPAGGEDAWPSGKVVKVK
jgi:hypothetical protein